MGGTLENRFIFGCANYMVQLSLDALRWDLHKMLALVFYWFLRVLSSLEERSRQDKQLSSEPS
jgi:hypothetical protein